MDLQTIQTIEFLENNKLLLDGLRLQYKRLKMMEQEDSPAAAEEFVSRQWSGCSKNPPGEDGRNAYRMQDPFTDFYMFVDREREYRRELLEYYRQKRRITVEKLGRAPEDRDAVLCWNTDMLRFYAVVEEILENGHDPRKLPDRYEELCDILAALMGSELCYMLHIHRTDVYVLANSAIPLNEGQGSVPAETLTRQELQLISGQLSRPEVREKAQAETVYQLDLRRQGQAADDLCEDESEAAEEAGDLGESVFWFSSRKRFPVLALRLQLPVNRGSADRDELCLVFQFETQTEKRSEPLDKIIQAAPVLPFALWKARNILVLRQKLLKIALRDRFILLTARKEYRYVKPLFPTDSAGAPSLRVMHLTDPHIQKSNCKDILNLVRSAQFSGAPWLKKGIDLLFITGDVVQGWNNAGELETNYKYALRVIRQIASILWGRDGKLRADWKKRVVIIPGNHDYASMNELEVISENGSRATGVGRPSKKEGGPMVKFAYYEEFLSELLDADIGRMNRMGLNEYREYSAMDLRVVGLNTSVGAGPLRNNKVALYDPFIQNVKALHNPGGPKRTIWLGHHTARYLPNYSVDRYYSGKIKSESRMEELVERFRRIVTSVEPEQLGTLTLEEKQKVQRAIDLLYRDLAKNVPPLVPEEDPLMADVLFFKQNWLSATNEQCSSIRHAILREMQMERADLSFCREKYRELYETAAPCLMLGGHIHEIHIQESCYEGDRFYTKDAGGAGRLNYAILELGSTDTHSWRTYQISLKKRVEISDQTQFRLDAPNGLDLEKLWNG